MLGDIISMAADRPGVLRWVKQIGEHLGELFTDIPVNTEFEILHPQEPLEDLESSEKFHLDAVIELAEQWSNLKEEDVAQKIAGIEQEAQSVGMTWPNYTPQLCYEIAQRVDSPLAWAEALFNLDASVDAIIPFLNRSADLDQSGWSQIAAKYLDVPRLRLGTIVAIITNENTPDFLLDKALGAIGGAARLINTYCLRNGVSDKALIRLLSHPSEEIATAAALGIWQAEPYAQVPEYLSAQWSEAFKNSFSDDFWIGAVLKSDPSLAFDWLEMRWTGLSEQQWS